MRMPQEAMLPPGPLQLCSFLLPVRDQGGKREINTKKGARKTVVRKEGRRRPSVCRQLVPPPFPLQHSGQEKLQNLALSYGGAIRLIHSWKFAIQNRIVDSKNK